MSTFRTWTAVALLVSGVFLCNLITARAQDARTAPLGRNLPVLDRGGLGDADLPCESLWGTVPLLMYDCSGGTLIGSVHEGLVLFSNGLAVLTRKDASDLRDRGQVEFRMISAASAKTLWQELMAAGAASACDDPVFVSDMPMTKVTVFVPEGTDAVAHTFAYYQAPSGGVANFSRQLIRAFIEAEFE